MDGLDEKGRSADYHVQCVFFGFDVRGYVLCSCPIVRTIATCLLVCLAVSVRLFVAALPGVSGGYRVRGLEREEEKAGV